MKIRFQSAKLRHIFNDYPLLQARYGEELADTIATRLAVLSAARHLGAVPRLPPVRLQSLHRSTTQFTVDLIPPRKLRFAVLKAGAAATDGPKNGHVGEIEVLAVD